MSAPVRLQKEVNMSIRDSIESFIIAHATFFLILFIVLMMAVFLTMCVMMCGMCALESGGMRNFLATGV